MKAALYARVSTLDQEPENQLAELRRYVGARSWPPAVEYIDKGVSGYKDRRPALDRLIRDATRRRFDVLICWRLRRHGSGLRVRPYRRAGSSAVSPASDPGIRGVD